MYEAAMHPLLLRPLLLVAILALMAMAPTLHASPALVTQTREGSDLSAEEAAIRDVIMRTNAQQEAAIAMRDSSLMEDTTTSRHYPEVERINDMLLDSGVTRLELLDLEWGSIRIDGPSAEVTTSETWAVTTRRGRTVEPPELNLYRLVQQDGVWKIDANEHPDQIPLPPGRPGQT
jgi:hypothetical protein